MLWSRKAVSFFCIMCIILQYCKTWVAHQRLNQLLCVIFSSFSLVFPSWDREKRRERKQEMTGGSRDTSLPSESLHGAICNQIVSMSVQSLRIPWVLLSQSWGDTLCIGSGCPWTTPSRSVRQPKMGQQTSPSHQHMLSELSIDASWPNKNTQWKGQDEEQQKASLCLTLPCPVASFALDNKKIF